MDLRQQVVQFKALLQKNDFAVDDFELNVNSDNFKELLSGGEGGLEVLHRKSSVSIKYDYDGTPSWLEIFADDLSSGKFQCPD